MDSILKQHKTTIRIMVKLKRDDSAKEHFKNFKIFTAYGLMGLWAYGFYS
jgi:hypothetical protein